MVFRDVSVEVLETGGLAKAEDLIMNESVSERVELVNIVGDLATFVRNIFRDKVVGAEGHTYGNDAVRDKNMMMMTFITRRGESQGKTKKERKATKSKGRGLEEGG